MDKYDIQENQTKQMLDLSFSSALMYGDWDINPNWLKYIKSSMMNKYSNFLAMLSLKFHLYLMEYDKSLPENALGVFEMQGEDEFNKWHKKISSQSREPKQPVVCVEIKKWRSHSSIEKVDFTKAVA